MSSSSAPEMAAPPSSDTVIDLMGSLVDLDSHQFSKLKGSLAYDLRLQRYRLLSLLFSPTHFSYVLFRLRSLSFYEKTTLLARLLIRTLHHFAIAIEPQTSKSPKAKAIALRDLDAAVLLMAMCESYDDNEEEEEDDDDDDEMDDHVQLSDDEWRNKIVSHLLSATLSPLGLGLGATFGRSIGIAGKSRRFLAAVCGQEKVKREVGAAITAVVSLESVRCGYQWKENCAICREELEEWRDVCEMPCKHRFHWGCILPWLRQRNTCPCCRFELPSDDVFCEIGRLWRVVTDATTRNKYQDATLNNH